MFDAPRISTRNIRAPVSSLFSADQLPDVVADNLLAVRRFLLQRSELTDVLTAVAEIQAVHRIQLERREAAGLADRLLGGDWRGERDLFLLITWRLITY